jgi:hypothetical protein
MKIFQFQPKCGAEKFRFRAQGASLEELLVRILGTVGVTRSLCRFPGGFFLGFFLGFFVFYWSKAAQPNAHTTQVLKPEFGHDSTPISRN